MYRWYFELVKATIFFIKFKAYGKIKKMFQKIVFIFAKTSF